ncbi:MAG TPA: NAD(+) kinase [Nevskiaceae bacterium]|nr:NAD(+) kinase [Nevskiaceae bacterium]
MSEFRTVGVIGKQLDPRVGPTLARLCEDLRALGCTLLVAPECAPHVDVSADCIASLEQISQRANIAVVVGGDGTLLSAARALAPAGVPILGINQGRLGFMVDVNPNEMKETLTQVFAGDYVREERLLLSARLRRDGAVSGPYLAVNDVVIRNQAAIRMLEFETWMDGSFISQHRADGMIVCSPTGSTAYALSGGGPVMHPGLEAFALVPICPHTLSDRPIVVGSRHLVRIVLGGAGGTSAMVTCDGQINETLNPGDAVEIERAPAALRLIHPRSYNYFDILRSKLHWGRARA